MGSIIGLIIVVLWILSLQRRVANLESKLLKRGESAQMANTYPQEQATQNFFAVSEGAPIPLNNLEHQAVREPVLQDQENDSDTITVGDRFVTWLKDDWLLKIGALLLLIGFGWFVTYAFLNDWIGPQGRIALGLLAGIIFMVLGWVRMKTYTYQGGVFAVLGSSVVILTLFAARELYNFFTPITALGLMFLSTAFIALLAVRYNHKILALLSLALAGGIPFLTGISSDYTLIFFYLLVVILGTLLISAITAWHELTLAGLILVTFYSVPHVAGMIRGHSEELLGFAFAFASIFFVSHTLGFLKRKGHTMQADIFTALLNGVLLLMWIIVAMPEEWVSLMLLVWSLVFAVGGFLTFKKTGEKFAFYTYALVGIVYIGTATGIEFDGTLLVIISALEILSLVFLMSKVTRDTSSAHLASVLFIIPAGLSLENLEAVYRHGIIFGADFATVLLVGAMLVGTGIYFNRLENKPKTNDSVTWGMFFVLIGTLYGLALIWVMTHAFIISDDTAVMVALVIYTLIGLTLYIRGKKEDRKAMRLYGAGLLVCVVGRLLLVEVWNMEITGKITTFFLVGALLMSTAFIGRHNKKGASLNDTLRPPTN